jgi:hypothetical protein
MSLFLGARELGLTTRWRHAFIPHGTRAETTPGVVFVDVGRGLRAGVVDHHDSIEGAGCTTEEVLAHPHAIYNHLLGPWLQRHDGPGIPRGAVWTPTLVTHADPDWDGVVACYLVRHLIENGEFPAFAGALASYTRDVDQGRFQLGSAPGPALLSPHLAYLALQHLELPWSARLERGFELIERVTADIESTRDGPWRPSLFDAGRSPAASQWASPGSGFEDLAGLLHEDFARFEEDRRYAALGQVALPAADGGERLQVPAFVLDRPPTSLLNKYWVRGSGHPFFICPCAAAAPAAAPPGVFSRVILSVDPHWVDASGRRPTLHGLGYALEREETRVRRQQHLERHGSPRFPGGYCDNEDPWYDGRSHDYTIVDAPVQGSVLPYDTVRRIMKSAFWEIPLKCGVLHLVYVRGPASSDARRGVPPFEGMSSTLLPLYEETAERELEPAELPAEVAPGPYRLRGRRRSFPTATSPAFSILTIEAQAGATLDGFVEARCRLVAAEGRPAYSIARVQCEGHCVDPARQARLLEALSDHEAQALAALDSDDERVLFNGYSVVLRQNRGGAGPEPDADFEILLYIAFLNETLIALSRRLSEQLPAGAGRGLRTTLRTWPLLIDMLRFQTRFYQLKVSRLPRGELLFSRLSEALGLAAHYQEVQQEIDRLRELQGQIADRTIQAILYAVTIAGAYQTLIAFFTLGTVQRPRLFWSLVSVVAVAAWWVYRTRVRQIEHESRRGRADGAS